MTNPAMGSKSITKRVSVGLMISIAISETRMMSGFLIIISSELIRECCNSLTSPEMRASRSPFLSPEKKARLSPSTFSLS